MREVVLDTETTGLEPSRGDRIVEIGAVELLNHLPTGRIYHQYINPQRSMPTSAFDVHGLSAEFLSNKPTFKAIAQELLDFIDDSKLVIHNATFDMKFLNAELGLAGLQLLTKDQAIDTLVMARRKFPGSPASLDALCRRFGVDNLSRTLHGALLDSQILAEVYLELVGGRQPNLVLSGPTEKKITTSKGSLEWQSTHRPVPLATRLSSIEKAAHEKFITAFEADTLWHNKG